MNCTASSRHILLDFCVTLISERHCVTFNASVTRSMCQNRKVLQPVWKRKSSKSFSAKNKSETNIETSSLSVSQILHTLPKTNIDPEKRLWQTTPRRHRDYFHLWGWRPNHTLELAMANRSPGKFWCKICKIWLCHTVAEMPCLPIFAMSNCCEHRWMVDSFCGQETPSHRCSKRMHQTIWASVKVLVVPHRFMASFPLWSCHTFWKGVHSVAKMPKLACLHFPWTGREGWMHCDDLLFCDIHIPSKSPKQLWVFLYHFISWSKWSHLYKLNQHSIKMAKFWCSILVQSCKSCL